MECLISRTKIDISEWKFHNFQFLEPSSKIKSLFSCCCVLLGLGK